MDFFKLKRSALLGCLVAIAVLVSGCGQPGSSGGGGQAAHTSSEPDKVMHTGWWCAEHGLPEEDCSMCSAKVAAKYKAKIDWCDKHNRAESQCFICDPSRAEKFEKLYVAKEGKSPPKRTE